MSDKWEDQPDWHWQQSIEEEQFYIEMQWREEYEKWLDEHDKKKDEYDYLTYLEMRAPDGYYKKGLP